MFIFTTVRNYKLCDGSGCNDESPFLKYSIWLLPTRKTPKDLCYRRDVMMNLKKRVVSVKVGLPVVRSWGAQLKNKIHFDYLFQRHVCEAATHSWMDIMAAKQ